MLKRSVLADKSTFAWCSILTSWLENKQVYHSPSSGVPDSRRIFNILLTPNFYPRFLTRCHEIQILSIDKVEAVMPMSLSLCFMYVILSFQWTALFSRLLGLGSCDGP